MADKWLDEILSIDGVEGALLISNRGIVLDKTKLPFENKQVAKLGVRILRMIGSFHLKEKNVTELELYWENYYIICKNSSDFTLITLCKSSKVLSLLRITLNISIANLLEDKKFTKLLKTQIADKSFTLKKGEFEEIEKKMISKLK
jgi:hypothetical protein